MRKSPKSELYKVFNASLCSNALLESFKFVIDGCWLLHNVIWPHSAKYIDIFQKYVDEIERRFGNDDAVVFDGYSSEIIGTKSYERFRRKEKRVGADIVIQEDLLCPLTKPKLLSNAANKFKFVPLLTGYLRRHNIKTDIAEEDGDTLIVKTAVDLVFRSH